MCPRSYRRGCRFSRATQPRTSHAHRGTLFPFIDSGNSHGRQSKKSPSDGGTRFVASANIYKRPRRGRERRGGAPERRQPRGLAVRVGMTARDKRLWTLLNCVIEPRARSRAMYILPWPSLGFLVQFVSCIPLEQYNSTPSSAPPPPPAANMVYHRPHLRHDQIIDQIAARNSNFHHIRSRSRSSSSASDDGSRYTILLNYSATWSLWNSIAAAADRFCSERRSCLKASASTSSPFPFVPLSIHNPHPNLFPGEP